VNSEAHPKLGALVAAMPFPQVRLLTAVAASVLAVGFTSAPSLAADCAASALIAKTISLPGALTDIKIDDNCRYVYVANHELNQIEVYSIDKGQLLAPIKAGSRPISMDFTVDGSTLYVANNGQRGFTTSQPSTIALIDTATHSVRRQITTVSAPAYLAVAKSGRVVFTVSDESRFVSTFDPATNTITERSDAYPLRSALVRASGDRSTIYLAEYNSSGGGVYKYDSNTDKFVAKAQMRQFLSNLSVNETGSASIVYGAGSARILDGSLSQISVIPNSYRHLVIDPAGSYAYFTTAVSAGGSNIQVFEMKTSRGIGVLPLSDRILASSGRLAMSRDGKLIAAITEKGLSLVPVTSPTDYSIQVMAFGTESVAHSAFRIHNINKSDNFSVRDGVIRIALVDANSGEWLKSWLSPVIPAGAAAEFDIAEIEAGITPRANYQARIEATFEGTLTHALKLGNGAVTNITNCSSGNDGVASANGLTRNVAHAYNSTSGFESTIRLTNTGRTRKNWYFSLFTGTDRKAVAGTRSYLMNMYPGEGRSITVAALEKELGIAPPSNSEPYIVEIQGQLTTSIQHTVKHLASGTVADFSQICKLPI
jgi:hypothetical protein